MSSCKNDSLNLTSTITVLVGKEKRPFTIYEELFDKCSTFFKAAFSRRRTDERQKIDLPSESPAVFNMYMNCVCLGKVTEARDDDNYGFMSVAALYVLADKLGDAKAANLCMDRVFQMCEENCPPLTRDVVEFCYASSHDSSPLRRLCIDLYIYFMVPEDYLNNDQPFPFDFNRDLAVAMMRFKVMSAEYPKMTGRDLFRGDCARWDQCRFHKHDKDMNPVCKKVG